MGVERVICVLVLHVPQHSTSPKGLCAVAFKDAKKIVNLKALPGSTRLYQALPGSTRLYQGPGPADLLLGGGGVGGDPHQPDNLDGVGCAALAAPAPQRADSQDGHEAVASLNVINRQGLAVSVADGDVVRELALELLSTPSFI